MLDFSRRSMILGATAGGTTLMARGALAQSPLDQAKPDPGSPPVFGPPEGVALLSRNENPFGPSPSALGAIYDSASKGCYYADGGVRKLTEMIAARFGLDTGNVLVSSGSTEALSAAALALPDGKAILCPELFWDTTVLYGQRKGVAVNRVPMEEDMSVSLERMAAAIGPDVGMVQICNPNNPTGMIIDGDAMRSFVENIDPSVTILVDEAYNELADRPDYYSVANLVKDHPNLIVCRTFSKIYGLAGMRVGYALAAPATVEKLRGYLMSFGGNTAGLAAAIASYEDEAFTRYSKHQIVQGREMILAAVEAAGLEALPSQTNFVYVKVPDADALQQRMRENGVMIRGAYGEWTTWSRVSTGRLPDVQRYAQLLPQLV